MTEHQQQHGLQDMLVYADAQKSSHVRELAEIGITWGMLQHHKGIMIGNMSFQDNRDNPSLAALPKAASLPPPLQ